MHPRNVLATAWTVLILLACLLPSRFLPVPEDLGPGVAVLEPDKIVHFGLFALFGLLWSGPRPSPRRALVVLLAGLALAVVSEAGQGLAIIDRDPSLYDALADMLGVLASVGAALSLGTLCARRHRLGVEAGDGACSGSGRAHSR